MNRNKAFLVVGVLLMLTALLVLPAVAQEEGTGGIIIDSTFGSDPETFNPLLANDTVAQQLVAFMYPGLLAVDPSQAVISPRDGLAPEFAGGTLVNSWEVSDDGLTYTFSMREDYTWSDGVPVTTADVAYAWEVIQAAAQGLNNSPANFIVPFVESVDIIDDYTFSVTFVQPTCQSLAYASALGAPLAPAHALGPIETLNDDPFNLAPTVFGGPLVFGEYRPAEQTSLLANAAYPDAAVVPTGYIMRVVPDAVIEVEQFLAGEISVLDDPTVGRRADLRAAAANGDAQVYAYPANTWDYFALNLADPNNPQPAVDADGNPVEQGNHPVLGDVRVRQAIARGIDVDSIIESAVFGEGTRMTSFIIPASWAYAGELPPIAFDPDAAMALLDEAGWVDHDNDPATPRIAQGTMYAEDGTELTFSLFTNEGNARRTAASTVIQDQLGQIGFQVNFQTIDFNVLVDIINAQTFDAVVLGWQNSYPDDPDVTQLFTTPSDIPNSGSNFTSYHNAAFDELNRRANDATETNGCDNAARAVLYNEMQEIFQQDLPYIPLYSRNGMYAAQAGISGFSPYPAQPFWNIPTWAVSTR
jgi:peptide/nickel transport system substrate-binding protein